MIKTILKAPKGRKGDLDFESYSEHGPKKRDYTHKRVVRSGKATGKRGQEYATEEFSRKGDVQRSRHNRKVTVRGKGEESELRSSSDHKVTESGPKKTYKVKSSNVDPITGKKGKPTYQTHSTKHKVEGSETQSSKSRKWTGENKDKRSKFKGKKGIAKLRKVKSDQPSYKKHYGDMLG